jgi:xeroderma pigmentosum group C-complementing protein
MVNTVSAAAGSSSRRNGPAQSTEQSNIYQELLDEAGVVAPNPRTPERPLKRRRRASGEEDRAGEPSKSTEQEKITKSGRQDEDDDDDLADVEFQDVSLPAPTMQTIERNSDDDEDEEDDDEEDIQFEDVAFATPAKNTEVAVEQANELELNLTAHQEATTSNKRNAERRRPITKEEKDRRVDIHKMHLLCLLSHVARRNHWCNDLAVQDYLRPHLTDKAIKYLTPGSHLSQFSRAESLKKGLQETATMWKTKFEVTERGMRRALWADDVQHLQDVSILQC